jgi:hypothetical protein
VEDPELHLSHSIVQWFERKSNQIRSTTSKKMKVIVEFTPVHGLLLLVVEIIEHLLQLEMESLTPHITLFQSNEN